MKIYGDYHTHTIYSHGHGTVLQNAISAKNAGLNEIAITDHGFGHLLYAVKRKKISKMRQDVITAQNQTGIRVLLGVEANFTSPHGDLDITPDEIKKLDILLVGMHRCVKTKISHFFGFFLKNLLSKKTSQKLIDKNTNCIIQTMEKYPIDILTHGKFGMEFDVERVAKKAVETNTLIELNNQKMCYSDQEIKTMIDLGVKFVIDSDAHDPTKIGQVQNSLEVVKKFNIPQNLVVNLDPNFVFESKIKKFYEI